MQVVVFSSGYPSKRYPLNGIFEFDQAKALADLGVKVAIAVVDLRSIRRPRKLFTESFYWEGLPVEVINIPCGRLPGWFMRIVGALAAKLVFKRILKHFGTPDILHAHFTFMAYAVTKGLKEFGIPIIATEHSSLVNQATIDKTSETNAKYAYASCTKLIAVSSALKKRIEDRFNVSPVCIPNIVDTNLFKLPSEHLPTETFNFTSVGSLVSGKNHEQLLEAFAVAFEGDPKVILRIFGEGPQRAKLEAKILQLNLSRSVMLMGQQIRTEIASHLEISDCFVLASKSETFGVAFVEALASGLPVIATRCGGPEDFISEDNGILVPVGNAQSLAEALQLMRNNIRRFNRKQISLDVRKRFSAKTVASQIVEVYNDALSENRFQQPEHTP